VGEMNVGDTDAGKTEVGVGANEGARELGVAEGC
jgi:hypothetical protein